MTAPTGQYDSEKRLNIGANRWAFKPEFGISKAWGPLDATYYAGGRTTLNAVESDDRQESVRVGGSLALPVDRYNSVKLFASGAVYNRTGSSFTAGGIAWQLRWGGGL